MHRREACTQKLLRVHNQAPQMGTETDQPSTFDRQLQLYLHMQQDSHARALEEIRRGRKSSHWIWWEWPAYSPVRTTSRPEFDLKSCGACAAWLSHETLGARWAEMTALAVGHLQSGVPAEKLFGSGTDAKKFHESCTLVSRCAGTPEQQELAARGLKALKLPPHEGVVKAVEAELQDQVASRM